MTAHTPGTSKIKLQNENHTRRITRPGRYRAIDASNQEKRYQSPPTMGGGIDGLGQHKTMRFCLTPLSGNPSIPVQCEASRKDIDNLLYGQIRLPDRGPKTPGPLLFDLYVNWCRSIGREDFYNRRLARRWLKLGMVRV